MKSNFDEALCKTHSNPLCRIEQDISWVAHEEALLFSEVINAIILYINKSHSFNQLTQAVNLGVKFLYASAQKEKAIASQLKALAMLQSKCLAHKFDDKCFDICADIYEE